jgi:hypothetical protein
VPEIGLLSSDVLQDHITILWHGMVSGVYHRDDSILPETAAGCYSKAGHHKHRDSR